ncbi:MAG: hypothetical protein HQK51_06295 [Oligoflexia bacterium]|nr:hypothetical protein [Oligoflexia bacterium]
MNSLGQYLKKIDEIVSNEEQHRWFARLSETIDSGLKFYSGLDIEKKSALHDELQRRIRTEEIKAWYSEPDGDSLFQGTSISSLTIPHVMHKPASFNSISDLEDIIAEGYISNHNAIADKCQTAIMENTERWIEQGMFYGVVICSKVFSQVFDLSLDGEELLFKIDGYDIDPHELTSYPTEIREQYFKKCKPKIKCFEGMNLTRREFESSLVLADISKPKIEKYKNKLLLAPVKCNEIAALLSRSVVEKIKQKSGGKINPKGLEVVIYDSDTPYTYHEIMGYQDLTIPTVLPGLTILGCSGTIDAFRWLYAYRTSLIGQKIQKGSIYSQVHQRFIPFVFMGVLVMRDADILLDMNKLSYLRYKGNISPDIEFLYLMKRIYSENQSLFKNFSFEHFCKEHLNKKSM